MSELLNSLNNPAPAAEKPWAQEVAEAGASEAPQTAPEPVSAAPAPEPAEQPEAAPEAPQATPEHAEETDRRVPLKALQEERQKRAEYERQVVEYQRQLAEYQAWAAQMQQQMGQPQPAEQVVEPDPETDPIGALKYARDQLRQMQEMTQRQQYEQQLAVAAQQAASQFRSQVPDYQDAYQYARMSRAQELAAFGAPEYAIPQILAQEEMQLVHNALQANRNPAEIIYSFAKARGFAGKQAAPEPAPAPAAPSLPHPQVTPDPALQQAKKAVAASATSSGPPASKGQISEQDLMRLNGAAFDSAWNKLFGGNKSSMFRE